ncbi:MAG: hypothetical protein Kow0099_17830 [Candidatus Abyssubacteria bacterium]
MPGRASPRRFLSLGDVVSSRLFLGEDHVLFVCSTYYSDSYKRFYFSDIQALVTTQTNGRRNTNIVYFIMIAIYAGIAGLLYWRWEWTRPLQYTFLGAGGVFMLLAGINTLLGPTCVCNLHTAVQVERLSCLGRLRTAQKAIGILKPLIEAAQGRLTAGELGNFSEDRERVRASVHAVSETPEPQKHEHGTFHMLAFNLLLVGAASSLVGIYFQHPLKTAVGLLLFLVMLVLLIFAVARQAESDLPKSLKSVTWLTLSFVIAFFFVGVIYGNIYRMSHPEIFRQDMWEAKFEGPVFVGLCIFDAAVSTGLGLFGIIRLLRFRSQHAERISYFRSADSLEREA